MLDVDDMLLVRVWAHARQPATSLGVLLKRSRRISRCRRSTRADDDGHALCCNVNNDNSLFDSLYTATERVSELSYVLAPG